jgi:hypothetical protein
MIVDRFGNSQDKRAEPRYPALTALARPRNRAREKGDNQLHRARVLEVRIHLPPADSPSLAGCLLPVWENPAVAAGWAGPAKRLGRQRRTKLVKIAPTADNISVGPYFSTAMPPARFGDSGDTGPQQARWLVTCRCWLGVDADRAQVMPSTIRCSCQPSGRRDCASSLSAVRSRG